MNGAEEGIEGEDEWRGGRMRMGGGYGSGGGKNKGAEDGKGRIEWRGEGIKNEGRGGREGEGTIEGVRGN